MTTKHRMGQFRLKQHRKAWRWQLESPNGSILAMSEQGYTLRRHAKRALDSFLTYIKDPTRYSVDVDAAEQTATATATKRAPRKASAKKATLAGPRKPPKRMTTAPSPANARGGKRLASGKKGARKSTSIVARRPINGTAAELV
jgi:uncharacterized protein YegP (UPF0339 family)